MPRGLFVTGTDTGVGKTAVSAALLHRYRKPRPLTYWKPVQTGCEQDDDTRTVRRLADAKDAEILDQGVRLPLPLSPHLAAHRVARVLDMHTLIQPFAGAPEDTRWVVEGAGGVLTPLNPREAILDLIVKLGLPALVVARTSLGTINHTRLTLEALRARNVTVAAVVMVGPLDPDNRAAIEKFGGVDVVGEMPRFPDLTPQALADWCRKSFDVRCQLAEYFA